MTQPVYRIKNWAKLYENNRTRELKIMTWVPIPNKQDGDGYTLILNRKNGAALFGAWMACVQIASKCDPRGTLVRSSGEAHNSSTLSRMSRIPEPIIKEMLTVCLDECKWLEINSTASECENPASPCDDSASSCIEWNGREWNGNSIYPPSANPDFNVFWQSYPRKVGKQAAMAAFKKHCRSLKVETLVAAIERQKLSEQWMKDGGKFIPNPATWLNQGRWEDELPPAAAMNQGPNI